MQIKKSELKTFADFVHFYTVVCKGTMRTAVQEYNKLKNNMIAKDKCEKFRQSRIKRSN